MKRNITQIESFEDSENILSSAEDGEVSNRKIPRTQIRWDPEKNFLLASAVLKHNAFLKDDRSTTSKWELVRNELLSTNQFKDYNVLAPTFTKKFHRLMADVVHELALEKEGANLSAIQTDNKLYELIARMYFQSRERETEIQLSKDKDLRTQKIMEEHENRILKNSGLGTPYMLTIPESSLNTSSSQEKNIIEIDNQPSTSTISTKKHKSRRLHQDAYADRFYHTLERILDIEEKDAEDKKAQKSIILEDVVKDMHESLKKNETIMMGVLDSLKLLNENILRLSSQNHQKES